MELLKESQIGKLVKKLESHALEKVNKWAKRLMESWKDLVTKLVAKPKETEKEAASARYALLNISSMIRPYMAALLFREARAAVVKKPATVS